MLALPLVVVGALNWGLVGLFQFDLVAELVGEEFGQVNLASRIVYVLVGLAGVALIPLIPARARAAQQTAEARKSYA